MVIAEDMFTWINIVCLLFLLICILIGVKRGFLLQLVNLIGMITSFVLAWIFAPVLADKIRLFPSSMIDFGYDFINDLIYPYVNQIAWFLIIVILIKIVIMVLKPIIKMLQKLPLLKQCNELFGGIIGGFNGLLWIMVVSMVLRLPFFTNGSQVIDETFIRIPSLIIDLSMEKMPVDFQQAKEISGILNDILSENKDDAQNILSDEDIEKIRGVLSEEQVEQLLRRIEENTRHE